MKRPKMDNYPSGSGSVAKSMEKMSRKRFHFFKIIQPYTIQHKRLGLPRKFIRKFGEELCEIVVLTVPSGSKWDVKLVEAEGEVWFQDGWQEFMEFHSIGVGHFLIFGYDGDSCFHVVVCDMGASEIDYPLPGSKDFEDGRDEDKACHSSSPVSEDSASLEILDVNPSMAKRADPMKKQKDDSQLQHLPKARPVEPPSPLSRRSSLPKIPLNVNSETCESDSGPSSSKDETKKIKEQFSDIGLTSSSESDGCGLPSDDESLSADVHVTAHAEENVSQSPSSDKSASLEILDACPPFRRRADPMKEVTDEREHQRISKMRRIEPQSRRRRFSLRMIERNVTRTRCDSYSGPSSGVKRPSKKTKYTTKVKEEVSSYAETRKTESDGYCLSSDEALPGGATVPVRIPAGESAIDAANAFKSVKPFCMIVMHRSYVKKWTLNIPFEFAKENLVNRPFITLRVSDGRTWEVGCYHDNTCCKIQNGWKNFVCENHLVEGDVCVFELVNKHQLELKVHIYRAQRTGSDGYSSSSDEESESGAAVPIRLPARESAIKAANSFKSVNPFCTVVMRPTYAGTPFVLNVPLAFAKKNLVNGPPFITLRVSDRRTWEVGYYHSDSCFKIKKGWKEFVCENHLVEGDVCVFELVNKYHSELKVHIYRARCS